MLRLRHSVRFARRVPAGGPWRFLGLLAALGSAAFTEVPAALADPLAPRLSDGVALPSQNPASSGGATSTLVNPANLAFLPGAELRLSAIHAGDAARLPVRGYAASAALPFWILASGLHVDWMVAPDAAPVPFALGGVGQRLDWLRWGNAVRLGERAAFGTTLAWSFSSTARTDALFSVSSGLTVRPLAWASASLVVRDWNAPSNDAGAAVGPSVDGALAFRPIAGQRWFELGLTGTYRSDSKRWGGGATLGVELPHVGALRAGAQLVDPEGPSLVASASLEVNVERLQAVAGAVFGNALTAAGTGFYGSVAWSEVGSKPRLPRGARVVKLRFDTTPDVRRHLRLLRRLWALARDPEVAGVVLVPRAEPAPSLAHAEELVDALRLLRASGKKVLCHLEDATGRELFVCAGADRIAMNPAGGIRFAGLASSTYYLGGVLEKLGVRADFVRIGKHKGAPEQFTTGPSETGLADQRALLAEYDAAIVEELARGRGATPDAMRARIAAGPLIAPEARDAKLVDTLAYEDELERFVEESFGERMRVVDLGPAEEPADVWGDPSKVAVVYLQGDMVDGESRDVPLVGIRLAGSNTIARALKRAREDRSVKAVVFRVETGGGSSLAADVILREVALTAKAKPLVVSMGSKAASGGYYVSVAAREIFANRSTLTGSIGIFYGKVDFEGLLAKLGVAMVTNRAEPRADAESLFRPFTDDEHEVLGRKVKQFYDLFVGRVAEGRKMSPEAVHAVAQGHVWTGRQAAERGLVDRVGGFRLAFERARELGGVSDEVPLLELPEVKKTLVDRALEAAGVPKLQAADAAWIPPPVVEVARALVPLALLGGDRPLARIEWLFAEP